MLESLRKSPIFETSYRGAKKLFTGGNLIRENEGADAGFASDTAQVPDNSGPIKTEYSEDEVESSIESNEEELEDTESGLDTPEGKEEASKISEMVDPLITVKTFKIYEDEGNVVMSGGFQNTDIEWQFSKNEGLFLNASNVNFTDNVKEMLDKLSAYYTNWQKDWAGKISEYTKNK